MKALTLFAAYIIAVRTATAAVVPEGPSPIEYHYFKSDGTEIELQNYSLPIMIKGVPIGTTELESTTASGASHHLSDGHHFGHEDWVINGSSWQYIEKFNDRRANLKRKIYTADSVRNYTAQVSGPGGNLKSPRSSTPRSEWAIFEINQQILNSITVEDIDSGYAHYYESASIGEMGGRYAPYTQIIWDAGGSASEFVVDLWSTDNVVSTAPIVSIVDVVDDVLNLLFDAFGFWLWF